MTRHFIKLKQIENQKEIERSDFNWRVQADQELIKREKATKLEQRQLLQDNL
jgi:hypothetical protein